MEVKRRRRDDDEPWNKMTSSTGITGKLLGWYSINMIKFWRVYRGGVMGRLDCYLLTVLVFIF